MKALTATGVEGNLLCRWPDLILGLSKHCAQVEGFRQDMHGARERILIASN